MHSVMNRTNASVNRSWKTSNLVLRVCISDYDGEGQQFRSAVCYSQAFNSLTQLMLYNIQIKQHNDTKVVRGLFLNCYHSSFNQNYVL